MEVQKATAHQDTNRPRFSSVQFSSASTREGSVQFSQLPPGRAPTPADRDVAAKRVQFSSDSQLPPDRAPPPGRVQFSSVNFHPDRIWCAMQAGGRPLGTDRRTRHMVGGTCQTERQIAGRPRLELSLAFAGCARGIAR